MASYAPNHWKDELVTQSIWDYPESFAAVLFMYVHLHLVHTRSPHRDFQVDCTLVRLEQGPVCDQFSLMVEFPGEPGLRQVIKRRGHVLDLDREYGRFLAFMGESFGVRKVPA